MNPLNPGARRVLGILIVLATGILPAGLYLRASDDGEAKSKDIRSKDPESKDAPTVVPEKWLNYAGPSFSWADLDELSILVFRFATWSGPAKNSFARLRAIAKRFEGRDLTIVGLTVEPPNRLRAFMKKYDDLPFVVGAGYKAHYNSGTIPHVWCVTKQRRVAWEGPMDKLTDRILDEAFGTAKPRIEFRLPPALFGAQKSLEKGDYAKGLAQLRRHLKNAENAKDEPAAKKAIEDIERLALDRLIDARRLAQERSLVAALEAAQDVEKLFKGTRAATKAKAEVREWKRDKRFKAARAAHQQLQKARKAVELKRPGIAIALLKRAVAMKNIEETQALADAQALLKELEEAEALKETEAE